MSISSEIRTAGPFTGTGAVASFSFTFKIFSSEDLYVGQRDNTTLVTTELVESVGYTLSVNVDQNNNPGGSVTLSAGALATGQTLYITSQVPMTQEVNLHNLGGFYPSVINDGLDRVVILLQQMKTDIDLAVKMSAFDTSGDVDAFIEDLRVAYVNIDDILLIASHMLDVITIGEDLRGDDNIGTVAGDTIAINTVASDLTGDDDIGTVADWLDGGGSAAAGVTYDNSTSGLTATNVQDAIDELAAAL